MNEASIQGFLNSYSRCALDFNIIEEIDYNERNFYRWSSPHLNELADTADIESRAAALKALFDGAMLVHTDGEHIIRPSRGPIEKQISTGLQLSHPFEPYGSGWKHWRYNSHENPTQHFVSASLFQARYDETVKHMLIFLGTNNANWISLYATLDFLKHSRWSEAKLAKGTGKEKSEFERFRRTANHFSAIGPFARHGFNGWEPPVKPMTLIEARMLIFESVRHVIKSYASQIDANFRAVT